MALVIVNDAVAAATHSPAGMPAAVRAQLVAALPAASRVLCIGDVDPALETQYRVRHPSAQWHSVALDALPTAAPAFDLLVLGTGLHQVDDAAGLLRALQAVGAANALLFVWVRNAAQTELFERLLESDLSTEPGMAAHSASSAFKRLMDAGWMPRLAAECQVAAQRADVLQAALAFSEAMGVPVATASRNLQRDHLIIESTAVFRGAAPGPEAVSPDDAAACFSVVVPTTRDTQLRLNVDRSPGLREVSARVVSCRDANSPADALARSLPHCVGDWVLLCHQDVYFAQGFGVRLNALLASVPESERDRTLFGFAGMGMNLAKGQTEPCGFVIDRTHRFDHGASDHAVSIDELAIVMSRQSLHRIDPQFGWHLWATDLCLAAMTQHQTFARIVRLPLFHNSNNDYQLPAEFQASAALLARKYAGVGKIPTLCGTIPAPAAA